MQVEQGRPMLTVAECGPLGGRVGRHLSRDVLAKWDRWLFERGGRWCRVFRYHRRPCSTHSLLKICPTSANG